MSKQKTYSLEQAKEKFIGKENSIERTQYEFDLQLNIVGSMIKDLRKKRELTQDQLGKILGVQKSEISKIESNSRNITISNLSKVMKALNAKMKLTLILED